MIDGFTLHGAGDVAWRIHHSQGTTIVYAPSEAIAIQRFKDKYPNLTVKSAEKAW